MVFCNNNKLRATLLHDETASVVLKNILVKMDSEEFGKRRSERLVGGSKALVKLVEKGAIRMRIDDNGRAYYNASDVLMNCRVKTTRNKRLASV